MTHPSGILNRAVGAVAGSSLVEIRRWSRLSLTTRVTGTLVGTWEVYFSDVLTPGGAVLFPLIPLILMPVDDAIAEIALGNPATPMNPFWDNVHAAWMRVNWVHAAGGGESDLYGTFKV